MAPNMKEIPQKSFDEIAFSQIKYSPNEKLQIVWSNVFYFIVLHIGALYGIYLIFTSARIWTALWAILMYELGQIAITAGVHRLWSHRSYKAKWQLRLLLTIFQTLAFQDAVVDWARDHRVHHKYSETEADPHNAKRGFFFSHMGWLMCRKSAELKQKGKHIEISDLYEDPILRYQKKYYSIFMPIMCFAVPTVIPMFAWNETFVNAFNVNIFRYVFSLHATWLVNSAAHLYGHKPYDKFINPSENLMVSVLVNGEGWHNYHHTFPWDYKTSELGKYSTNMTTAFIDLMAKIGWAYELKSVPSEYIQRRVERTGDGSHSMWGWGDKDQSSEDIKNVIIKNSNS